ncbi:SDR family NAD(P)-dependent oxidoreductase [Paenibacillus taiwanensis]|uniref:SDR family NAD(P)-dependent oxidoreductase n=1 Tax=Paenibacillus taiwanensis TaxID=401638 RepID=UPI00040DDA95|nr:SDR family NAD(P)-dependent oxidoreductase [Paenibacillus taiwanensis]
MKQPMIWIVGAGCGIGLGIAKTFGKRGYLPLLITREESLLEAMKQALIEQNVTAEGTVAYAGDETSLRNTLNELEQQYGVPDVLIYNASAHTPGYPSEVAPSDMLADLQVNVIGALTAAQCVLSGMRTRGTGSILFTGGGQAIHPTATLASLGVGKSSIRNLALSLHDELKNYGLYAGTLTISGFVQPGTAFSPDVIGEAFYRMHQQKNEAEVIIRP